MDSAGASQIARRSLGLLAHVLLSLVAAAFSMLLTLFVTAQVQVNIHGQEAFEHDAGADFALFVLSAFFALPIGAFCFAAVLHRLRTGNWIPRSSPKPASTQF